LSRENMQVLERRLVLTLKNGRSPTTHAHLKNVVAVGFDLRLLTVLTLRHASKRRMSVGFKAT
jgi:hypothetical protein